MTEHKDAMTANTNLDDAVRAGLYLSQRKNLEPCLFNHVQGLTPKYIAEACLSAKENINSSFRWSRTTVTLREINIHIPMEEFQAYYVDGSEGSPWVQLMLQTMAYGATPLPLEDFL